MSFRYACDWPRAETCLAKLDAIADDPARPLPVSPVIAAALIGDAMLQLRAIRDFATHTLPPVQQARPRRRSCAIPRSFAPIASTSSAGARSSLFDTGRFTRDFERLLERVANGTA